MASPGAQGTGDIDMGIDPAITGMSNGSCSSSPPSTISYSTPDPSSYSEVPVSHISSFDASPVLDGRLLTPVSSAASPQLQQRSCRQSSFEQHHHHQHHHQHHHHQHHLEGLTAQQQPTTPHTASMYPYLEFLNEIQATSSMPMPTTVADASSHDQLLPFLQQHLSPPSHEDPQPSPQSHPFSGSYTISAVPHHEQNHYYLPDTTGGIGPLGLLRDHVTGAYTHRPLAPVAQHPLLFGSHPPSPYRLTQLTPAPLHSRQYSVPRARHDRSRKNSARKGIFHKDSFSPPELQPQQGEHVYHQDAAHLPQHHGVENDGPDEEVTLDDKTPADLRRLWNTRLKWLGRKGNGMWEDIMMEYLGEDSLSENKKTQVKAALQMKIHRMLLKHGKWPERDKSALLRAYKRFEESRYTEILRIYEEEMAGHKKAYEWKSQHIEAQLVKMGLEQPEHDRDSKARRRKHVAARHQARAGGMPVPPRPPQQPPQQHRRPGGGGVYAPAPFGHQYAPEPQQHRDQHQHRTHSHDSAFAEQVVCAQPPALSDEQNHRLAREILAHNPFVQGGEDGEEMAGDDADVKMECGQ